MKVLAIAILNRQFGFKTLYYVQVLHTESWNEILMKLCLSELHFAVNH